MLQRVYDFFVARQKERGDGKCSGTTYPDSRAARSLLAAYDLLGEKAYLDSAIAWGDAVIAEQREDGGYRMGYGISQAGEECFVADKSLRKEIEAYLDKALVTPLTSSDARWWVESGGRSVLSLSALSYYNNTIQHRPDLLARIIKASYALCGESSDDAMLLLLMVPKQNSSDWHYLAYGGVGLAEILRPGITMRPVK